MSKSVLSLNEKRGAIKHLAILYSLSRFYNVLGACADELDMEELLTLLSWLASWNCHGECGSHSDLRSQILKVEKLNSKVFRRYIWKLRVLLFEIWFHLDVFKVNPYESVRATVQQQKIFLFSTYKAFFLMKFYMSIYSWLGFLLLSFIHFIKKNPEYFARRLYIQDYVIVIAEPDYSVSTGWKNGSMNYWC